MASDETKKSDEGSSEVNEQSSVNHSPRGFMKARRPELFSDTPDTGEARLSKVLLEYELESLSSKDKHFHFERLCYKLVQKEICPNVKPSTGPSSGGDGGTDAATYPVSDGLALRSYAGVAKQGSSSENWAFAFSCKKTWKSKAKEDINKIIGLDKNFDRIFFITSQFAREKDSDELEDEFRKKFGVEVQILDRTWILSKILDNGREDLAIEALGIDIGFYPKPKKGVRDYAREESLNKIEESLQNVDEYNGNDVALIQDYLKAATLSRGLEEPREKTMSFYLQAAEIARSKNYSELLIRVLYNQAWTSYFWFEDAARVADIYCEMEKYLDQNCSAEVCERFVILMKILITAQGLDLVDEASVNYESRRDVINLILTANISDSRRPNNSLFAETLKLNLELLDCLRSGGDASVVFEKLGNCLERCDGLGTYPALRFTEIVIEMGDLVGELEGYNELFEKVSSIKLSRDDELRRGELLFKRGYQIALTGNIPSALDYLGRARNLLSKSESIEMFLDATITCSDFYMKMGFYWAARSELLVAAQMSLHKEGGDFKYPILGLEAVIRLIWLEILLGRVPQILSWFELGSGLCDYLTGAKFVTEKAVEDLRDCQNAFCCLISTIEEDQLSHVNGLKSALEKLGLVIVAGAIKYREGNIREILEEAGEAFNNSEDEVKKMFENAKIQPLTPYLPKRLVISSSEYSEYITEIFGVKYVLKTRNRFATQAFSENLMGIIESALALAKWENLAFIVDEVKISVDLGSNGSNPPEIPDAPPMSNIGYNFYFGEDMADWLYDVDRKKLVNYFNQFFAMMLMHITIDTSEEIIDTLEGWFTDNTFSRALGTSPTIIPLRDLLGSDSYEVDDWK